MKVVVEAHRNIAHQQTASRLHLDMSRIQGNQAVISQRLQARQLGGEIVLRIDVVALVDGQEVDL